MAKTPEMLRKITLGTCNAQPDAEEIAKMEKSGKPLEVLDVFGIARKFKPGASAMGEYVKFIGDFKAVNLVTGDEYTSATLILPRFLEEQLYGVMGGDGTANDVQFGFRIRAQYDKKAATKYVYAAQPLLKPSENSPLAMLEATIAENRKALPAPKS